MSLKLRMWKIKENCWNTSWMFLICTFFWGLTVDQSFKHYLMINAKYSARNSNECQMYENGLLGFILPSTRYNTRVLAFSQSRSVDFNSPTPTHHLLLSICHKLLHLCSTSSYTQNCLQLDCVHCPKDLSSCSWFSQFVTCCREIKKSE